MAGVMGALRSADPRFCHASPVTSATLSYLLNWWRLLNLARNRIMSNLSVSRARFLVTFLDSCIQISKIEDNSYVLSEHCETMPELMLIALSDMGARMDEKPNKDDENAKIIKRAREQLTDDSVKKQILGLIGKHCHGMTCAELGRDSRKYRALDSKDQTRILDGLVAEKYLVNITIPPRSGRGKARNAYFSGPMCGKHGS